MLVQYFYGIQPPNFEVQQQLAASNPHWQLDGVILHPPPLELVQLLNETVSFSHTFPTAGIGTQAPGGLVKKVPIGHNGKDAPAPAAAVQHCVAGS